MRTPLGEHDGLLDSEYDIIAGATTVVAQVVIDTDLKHTRTNGKLPGGLYLKTQLIEIRYFPVRDSCPRNS